MERDPLWRLHTCVNTHTRAPHPLASLFHSALHTGASLHPGCAAALTAPQCSCSSLHHPCAHCRPNRRPLGSSLCTTGSDYLVLLLPPHFLTRFHPNSVGLPHVSDWLWAAPFSPCQCHCQASQFIPNALRLAPEFASCSVALWGNKAPTNTLGDVQLLAICTGTGS